MTDFSEKPADEASRQERFVEQEITGQPSADQNTEGRLPVNRPPHEAQVRSKLSRPAETDPAGPDTARHEETWMLGEEMRPGLLMPRERWLAEFEQTKRRDRHNLIVLLTLVGYLVVCGSVAAWLLVSGVDQQTVNYLMQVFVVSLIPVIVLIARSFHRG
jgi:hypothetical protein